jgi:hypothetical protein
MDQDQKCSCKRGIAVDQQDYYGIYAGKMCDKCFEEKYRQDAYYDYLDAGEHLEPEDY